MNIKRTVASLVIISFFFSCMEKPDTRTLQNRPNIVWLVSEDNSAHYLKLYDEGGAPMPNIETLAESGIVFNNAFSNAPVCSVARSTIISGCYAPRVGTQYHRKIQLAPMPKGLKMFPEYLREAGYYTSNNSKEDYNFIKSNNVWDESSKNASYRNRKEGQPFFHVQNFGTTHEGQLHFTRAEMDSLAPKAPIKGTTILPYHPNTPIFGYTNARYRDLQKKVDVQIGEFVRQLESDGLMDNTIIFYYGDHGGVLPRSKGYIYESGLHVPMVIYIPEKWRHLSPIAPGHRTDAFVEFIDLAPTVLNLAGIEIPEQIDGRPFLGKKVTQETLDKKNTALGYADRFDEKYDLVRSLRKGNFKYIRNYQPFNIDALFNFYRYKMLAYKEWQTLFQNGELNAVQQQFFQSRAPEALYNIEEDPHEITNLVNDPAYSEALEALRDELKERITAMPDLSFYPEPYFLEKGLADPVDFGQRNKTEIAELVAIADLTLEPFRIVEKDIEEALTSDNPWKRYWGLVACSTFGKKASPFFKRAVQMAKGDNENLVRLRAVEFLMLHEQNVPTELLLEIVENAKSESEATLMLNTLALLKTVNPSFNLKLPKSMFPTEWMEKEGDLVLRRIEFINEKKI
ncbi:MAG: sulfatase [Bacteroidota bacterium]